MTSYSARGTAWEDATATLPRLVQSGLSLRNTTTSTDPALSPGRHNRSQVRLLPSKSAGTKRADLHRPQPLHFSPLPSSWSSTKRSPSPEASPSKHTKTDKSHHGGFTLLSDHTLSQRRSVDQHPAPLALSLASTERSNPIAIPRYNQPSHHQGLSRGWNYSASSSALPFTPLTAREEKESYFPLDEAYQRPSMVGQLLDISTPKHLVPGTPPDQLNMHPSSPFSPAVPKASKSGPSVKRSKPNDGELKLNNMPRFHPAIFQPATTNRATSPQQQQRQFYEAQKRLHHYQRELLSSTSTARIGRDGSSNPDSPRLIPLGSPGPVTPLQLEEQAEYFLVSGQQPDGTPDHRADRHRNPQSGLSPAGAKR